MCVCMCVCVVCACVHLCIYSVRHMPSVSSARVKYITVCRNKQLHIYNAEAFPNSLIFWFGTTIKACLCNVRVELSSLQ